jgi:hypothetical protein
MAPLAAEGFHAILSTGYTSSAMIRELEITKYFARSFSFSPDTLAYAGITGAVIFNN